MLAVSLALGAALAWGVADFLAGLASRRLPVPVVLLAVQGGGLVVIALITVAAGEPWIGGEGAVLALVAGAAGVTALGCFYAALAMGTMSVVAPIAATGVALPVLVGLATGDSPSALAAGGLVLAAAGCVLASREAEADASRREAGRRAAGLALLAACGFGVFLTTFDAAADESELWTLTLLRTIALPLVGPLAWRAVRRTAVARRAVLPVLGVGVIDMSATALLALASTRGELSVVSVLGSLYPVVTVVLAAAVLHERLARLQLAGVALALTGVVLIAAG